VRKIEVLLWQDMWPFEVDISSILSCVLLPLLRKLSRLLLAMALLKLQWLWCYFNPISFSPNLFCSTSLLCSTYFMQVERMVEVDQAESCKPSCLRSTTVLLPPQPFFAFTYSTEQATVSSKFRLSLKSAKITLINLMATAHRISFFRGSWPKRFLVCNFL